MSAKSPTHHHARARAAAHRSPLPRPWQELAASTDLETLAADCTPPLDALAPSLYKAGTGACEPAVPCLQVADFTLIDAEGQLVATQWLCRLLGGPGGSEPTSVPTPIDEDARAAAYEAAIGVAVRVDLGVRRLGANELKAPSRKRKASERGPKPERPKKERGGASEGRRRGATADDSEDEEGEEEGEEEEDTSNWACCDKCGKWRRLPAGEEYCAEALGDGEWFCTMNPDGRRNTCQKPEERFGPDEKWDGVVQDDGDEEDEELRILKQRIPDGFEQVPWQQRASPKYFMLWQGYARDGDRSWTYGEVSASIRHKSFTHDVWLKGMPPGQFRGADLSVKNYRANTWVMLKKTMA